MSDLRVTRSLVLAGAVAKGAFEAGVLRELAERGLTFDRIVGTSAGALTGAIAAAGLACGRFREATEAIEALWRDKAAWHHVLQPTLSLRGLSSTSRVRDLVTGALEAYALPPEAARLPVALSLVTTDLHGTIDDGHFSYESSFSYDQVALVDRSRHAEIAAAAAASAAVPMLFEPPTVAGRPRVDGGAVNNAPISYVLDGETRAEIYLVLAESEPRDATGVLRQPPVAVPPLWGPGLWGKLADIVTQERIERDLHVALERNQQLEQLEQRLDELDLAREQRRAILGALGWRHLDIVPIRPLAPLEGSPVRGFFSRAVRQDYIDAGKKAAAHALEARARTTPQTKRARRAAS